MIDPRTPDLIAYIDELTTAWDQVLAMRALCAAFPYLRVCTDWSERLEELEDAMHLTLEERAELGIAAARAAGSLRR